MQAAGRRVWRWATVSAVSAALLAGLASTAEARVWWGHHGWHGYYHGYRWAPYLAARPFFAPYSYPRYYSYYTPYYYAPPPVTYAPTYAPPVATYPEPTYMPYAAPGLSFNFSIP